VSYLNVSRSDLLSLPYSTLELRAVNNGDYLSTIPCCNSSIRNIQPRTGTPPWQIADIEGRDRISQLAQRNFEMRGSALYNCSEGGKLEIFVRMPLSEFLGILEG
jgi:hypothetical protein